MDSNKALKLQERLSAWAQQRLFIWFFFCISLVALNVASAQTTTLGYTGGIQSYTLPVGSTGVTIDALGAGGGGGGSDASGTTGDGAGGSGANGATARGTFLSPAGTLLNVAVGGGGTGGFTSNFGKTCTSSAGLAGGAGGAAGFGGGNGGQAGCSGYSGGGGGGGGGDAA